jgi:ABC-type glycerol-3-phosphate transport system substrate-binding protein
MMKIKFLNIIITLFLIATGCSEKQKDDRVVVSFWHSFVSSTIPSLNELIDRFETEHPDIRINAQYVPTGDALIQKLVTAIQSNTAPDISWLHADFLNNLVEADAIYDMSVFVNSENGFSDEEIADIYEQLIQTFTHRGILYAIPMEATTLALVYNKDHFRAAGLDPEKPPQTWQELREYAQRLTIDKDGDGKTDQYGFYIPAYPASGPLSVWVVLQWSPYVWQAGGEIIRDDQSGVLFNSEAGVAALSLWRDIYNDLNFSAYSFTHDMGFASGSLSMIMDGPWDLPTFRKMKNVDWGVTSLPAGPVQKATYIAGEGLAIFKQSKNPDAAWSFIKWVAKPEIQAMFSMSSGYLPIRKSVLDREDYKEFLENDHAMRGFVEQIPIAKKRPSIDRFYIEINQNIADAIEKTIIGRADPKSALDDAARRSNSLLTRGK